MDSIPGGDFVNTTPQHCKQAVLPIVIFAP